MFYPVFFFVYTILLCQECTDKIITPFLYNQSLCIYVVRNKTVIFFTT